MHTHCQWVLLTEDSLSMIDCQYFNRIFIRLTIIDNFYREYPERPNSRYRLFKKKNGTKGRMGQNESTAGGWNCFFPSQGPIYATISMFFAQGGFCPRTTLFLARLISHILLYKVEPYDQDPTRQNQSSWIWRIITKSNATVLNIFRQILWTNSAFKEFGP